MRLESVRRRTLQQPGYPHLGEWPPGLRAGRFDETRKGATTQLRPVTRFGFWLISITFFFSACSRKETRCRKASWTEKHWYPFWWMYTWRKHPSPSCEPPILLPCHGDYMDFILRQHGLDTATYARTIRYYGEHPICSELYDDVIDELSRIRGSAAEKRLTRHRCQSSVLNPERSCNFPVPIP